MRQTAKRAQADAAAISVRRLGVNLGAAICGVDLRQPLDDAARDAIAQAHAEHGLLLFPDQDITADQLMAFGARFGALSVHPFAPADEARPALIRFENSADNPPFGTDFWHSDETFREAPPMGTMLCAKEVPALGGDTMFASMAAAYEGLSNRMQAFISGLEAVHDIKPFRTIFADTPEDRALLQDYERRYPPVTHPVVRVHPVTGRKVIFVNPQFTIAVKDMDERESAALLETLFHQAFIPEVQFRLHWAPHMIAFWDNRSVQHYAVHDYYPQRRVMERVTITGDRPIGVDRADPASVQRAKAKIAGAVAHGGHKPRT
ncbi:MAG TPA: TauD/TfdA family dioxygenase [Alphaproteobacteria bacterium]|nr:TauD/TfdA family dioxygenase [Alphaproteobacteria bacterium]